jgi:membrane dipeptidase
MQINFSEGFLSQEVADAPRAGRGVAADPNRPRATLDDLVAHIDHVVKLVGIDYVGLGSDYDGVPGLPLGLDDVSKLPNLTRALLERGYKPEEIRKIYGGNLLRVMRAVEKGAAH